MGKGSVESWTNPSASFKRRAGSTVITAARRRWRAAATPSAAATVVLPTPPGPTQMSTRLVNRLCSFMRCSADGGRDQTAEPLEMGAGQFLVEDHGQREWGDLDAASQTRD